MLPSGRKIFWWLVAMVLWATVVWSVQETPDRKTTDLHEIQQVEDDLYGDPPSEETRLLEQLQARLEQIEERERALQLREEQVAALQRDVEALAARQAKQRALYGRCANAL